MNVLSSTCFICRPSDSTVSEEAGTEPRTVSTSALAVRRSSYSAHLIHSRVHLIHTRLHLIHTRLHLIHTFLLFSSAEWFGTEFREFRNSQLFSRPLKGSKGNFESLLLFLVNGTEFLVVFSSAEGFGTEFRQFLFRGTAGIPSEITICSVYSVFRGIIFWSEIPNPNPVFS
jgi:hypothetical protein